MILKISYPFKLQDTVLPSSNQRCKKGIVINVLAESNKKIPEIEQ